MHTQLGSIPSNLVTTQGGYSATESGWWDPVDRPPSAVAWESVGQPIGPPTHTAVHTLVLPDPIHSRTHGYTCRKRTQCGNSCLGAGGNSLEGGREISKPTWVVCPRDGHSKLSDCLHETQCSQRRTKSFLKTPT